MNKMYSGLFRRLCLIFANAGGSAKHRAVSLVPLPGICMKFRERIRNTAQVGGIVPLVLLNRFSRMT